MQKNRYFVDKTSVTFNQYHTGQRLCFSAQPYKRLHVDQIQDGVQTDRVTKLDFQKKFSASLLTSEKNRLYGKV